MAEYRESTPPSIPAGRQRWVIVALLFVAMVMNYVDRQTLGILKPAMSAEFKWTNSDFANIHLCFQAAYAACYLGWGRVVDRFGARCGFALAFAVWSAAQLVTSAAREIGHFMFARMLLGVGESGAFPGSIKAIAEWFPQKERALANGLFNAGTNIGAIVTPLLIPALVVAYGWQVAFVASGLAGLVWLPIWLLLYRNPRDDARVSAAELRWIDQDSVLVGAERIGWRRLLRLRETWTYALAKFMTDPIFGMYLSGCRIFSRSDSRSI